MYKSTVFEHWFRKIKFGADVNARNLEVVYKKFFITSFNQKGAEYSIEVLIYDSMTKYSIEHKTMA